MTTLTTREAAELLRTTETTIRRKANDGSIPADKPFGRWIFDRDELIQWKQRGRKYRDPLAGRPR